MDRLVYSDDNKFNIEQNFKEFLLKYQEKLSEFQENYNFTSNNEFIDTRYREKSIESIFYKIRYFNSEENRKKVPIQKCLNYIVGFRIILEGCILNSGDEKKTHHHYIFFIKIIEKNANNQYN